MLRIGCHLSSAKGFAAMGRDAVKIGAGTFQFFTRNPRGSKAKDIDPEDVEKLLKIAAEHDISSFLAHAPYTLNACSDKEETREFAHIVMEDDLKRMEYLPGAYYNFHPGSHCGQGTEVAIELISELLNSIMEPEQHSMVLLETMAGKGSEVGGRFEEIARIRERTRYPGRIGVCFDTCHVYDAGYDIVKDLDGVLAEFDSVIGIDALKAVHLNDSKNPFESHKDRHEQIGRGSLGLDAMAGIINHPLLRDKPFYLETPNDLEGYGREIALLKSLYI